MHEGKIQRAQFVIARGHPTKLLQAVEKALHFFAERVAFCIIVDGLFPVFLRRNDRGHTLVLEPLADVVTIIAAVHDRVCERLGLGQLIQDLIKARRIMALAPREHKRDTGGFVYAAGMDFGGKSSPRAAQSLGRLTTVFFNAPAAC